MKSGAVGQRAPYPDNGCAARNRPPCRAWSAGIPSRVSSEYPASTRRWAQTLQGPVRLVRTGPWWLSGGVRGAVIDRDDSPGGDIGQLDSVYGCDGDASGVDGDGCPCGTDGCLVYRPVYGCLLRATDKGVPVCIVDGGAGQGLAPAENPASRCCSPGCRYSTGVYGPGDAPHGRLRRSVHSLSSSRAAGWRRSASS